MCNWRVVGTWSVGELRDAAKPLADQLPMGKVFFFGAVCRISFHSRRGMCGLGLRVGQVEVVGRIGQRVVWVGKQMQYSKFWWIRTGISLHCPAASGTGMLPVLCVTMSGRPRNLALPNTQSPAGTE